MQKNNDGIVSVKKVISIINSCETKKQLDAARRLIDNYVLYVQHKGLINPETVYKRLLKEHKQKCFQIRMISLFVRNDRKEFTKEFKRVSVRAIA